MRLSQLIPFSPHASPARPGTEISTTEARRLKVQESERCSPSPGGHGAGFPPGVASGRWAFPAPCSAVHSWTDFVDTAVWCGGHFYFKPCASITAPFFPKTVSTDTQRRLENHSLKNYYPTLRVLQGVSTTRLWSAFSPSELREEPRDSPHVWFQPWTSDASGSLSLARPALRSSAPPSVSRGTPGVSVKFLRVCL